MSVLDTDTRRVGRLLHYAGLLLVAVCGSIAYDVAYVPATQGIEDTYAVIDELKKSEENAPVIRREHEKEAAHLASVTERISTLHQRVPEDADAGDFLRQVTQIAAEQHLAISNFQPDKTAEKDGYAEMEVTLTGKGGFASICRFFDRLAKLPRLSKVRQLSISNGNVPGEYAMTATLLIYFGLNEADVAPPKKEVRRG